MITRPTSDKNPNTVEVAQLPVSNEEFLAMKQQLLAIVQNQQQQIENLKIHINNIMSSNLELAHNMQGLMTSFQDIRGAFVLSEESKAQLSFQLQTVTAAFQRSIEVIKDQQTRIETLEKKTQAVQEHSLSSSLTQLQVQATPNQPSQTNVNQHAIHNLRIFGSHSGLISSSSPNSSSNSTSTQPSVITAYIMDGQQRPG